MSSTEEHIYIEQEPIEPFINLFRGGKENNKSAVQNRHLTKSNTHKTGSVVNGLPVFLDRQSASKYGDVHSVRVSADEIPNVGLYMNSKHKSNVTGDTEEVQVSKLSMKNGETYLLFDKDEWNSLLELKQELKSLGISVQMTDDYTWIKARDFALNLRKPNQTSIEFHVRYPEYISENMYSS